MEPRLTPSLALLRDAFNYAFPGRDKTSDGWIGDTAHQRETSGHNPDDTPGVSAEYSDPDNIPEVRAVDVDAGLKTFSMWNVISSILSSPRDLRKLKYIIHHGYIWRAKNGWVGEPYTGPNNHFEHAHFSGNPDTDNDTSGWESVRMFKPSPLPPQEEVSVTVEFTEPCTQGASVVHGVQIAGQQRDTVLAIAAEFAVKASYDTTHLLDLGERTFNAVQALPTPTVTLTAEDRAAIVTDVTAGVIAGLSALQFVAGH